MAKLTVKQRANYAAAEEHIRAKLCADMRCLWEIPRPKGTAYAMLAGFACMYRGTLRLFILQVWNESGWEIFAAPGSPKIDGTIAAVKAMWDADVANTNTKQEE